MTKTNFVTAAVTKNTESIVLEMADITYEELPMVSVITITHNRSHFFTLMWNNWNNYKYPKEKLEWVIVDDSTDPKHDLTDIIPQYNNIRYIKLDKHMTIGDKRNYAVSQCSYDYIVHQDDDDFYFPDSILAKVRVLKKYKKCDCCFSNSLAVYNIINNTSCFMNPENAESCLSLPEATLMYKKSFWEKQKFSSEHFTEGKSFVIGREKSFVSIPCIFNMISFTHSKNVTGKTRSMSLHDINAVGIDVKTTANFYKEFDPTTKNIIRKLSKESMHNFNPTQYRHVMYSIFPHEEIECDEFTCNIKTLGKELDLFQHLGNWHKFNKAVELNTLGFDLTEKDLVLVAWYCPEIININDKNPDESDDLFLTNPRALPSDAIEILKNPRAKLLVFNSWECRDLTNPLVRTKIVKYCIDNLPITIDNIIFATTDFMNPTSSIVSPQVIGYDFPYLVAKSAHSQFDITDGPIEDRKYTIMMPNRRSSDERAAVALFLYHWYREKCLISYLTVDKYDPNVLKTYGTPITSLNEFEKELPLEFFQKKNPMQIQHYDREMQNAYGKPTIKVNWDSIDEIKSAINQSFIMLIMETNNQLITSRAEQVSEKTYKPIRSGMPFIIFTSKPGILKHLRSLGFKTFDPIINESYDHHIFEKNCDDAKSLKNQYNKRIRRLLKELNRLCRLSRDELIELWEKCRPIVQHNLSILRSRDKIRRLPIIE